MSNYTVRWLVRCNCLGVNTEVLLPVGTGSVTLACFHVRSKQRMSLGNRNFPLSLCLPNPSKGI